MRHRLPGALVLGVMMAAAAVPAASHEDECAAGLVCVTAEPSSGGPAVWVESRSALPLVVGIAFGPCAMQAPEGPVMLRFDGRDRKAAALLQPGPGGERRCAWRYSLHPATPGALPDEGHVYRLPFRSGEAFVVSQGFDGPATHRGRDRYAVDFEMPPGTPVLAARAGRVLALRDDSHAAGVPGAENYVWLRHDDGTVGQYLHLSPGSARVRAGERVEAGRVLAESGRSGQAGGPHLHFHVSVATPEGPEAYRTIPLRFATADGPRPPVEGERLAAP